MGIWNRVRQHPELGLVLLAYVAFIALGMPDGLLGVAWPSVRADFAIPLDAVGVLIAVVMTGYTVSSFVSGPLIARLGVGRILAISCALSGAGLLGYTLVPAWWMMVLLGVVAGLGAGAIDAGLNTYVAAHFGEGLMQWLHACYGIGVTLGPIIMTFALTTWASWRLGYRVVGLFELALAACFVLTLSLWDRGGKVAGGSGAVDAGAVAGGAAGADAGQVPAAEGQRRLTDYKTSMLETLREPQVWLSAVLFFLYVGAESSLGTWTYSLLTGTRGIAPAVAGLWAGGYWATFTIGRIVAGVFARRAGVNNLVVDGLLGALLGAGLLIWNPSAAANLVGVALIGVSIGPIFPALMSGTSRRVGARFAANTIGMQMAATGLGIGVIPGLLGVLARRISLDVIPVCLLAIYALLLGLYALAMLSDRRLAAAVPITV